MFAYIQIKKGFLKGELEKKYYASFQTKVLFFVTPTNLYFADSKQFFKD